MLNQSHSNSLSLQESIFLTPSYILHLVIFCLDPFPYMSHLKKWPTRTVKWAKNGKFPFYTYLDLQNKISTQINFFSLSTCTINLIALTKKVIKAEWCQTFHSMYIDNKWQQIQTALTLNRVRQNKVNVVVNFSLLYFVRLLRQKCDLNSLCSAFRNTVKSRM